MAVKFSNNASTLLSTSVNATATSITVDDATNFPTLGAGDYTYVTIDADSVPASREVVKVTGISGNVFTIERGQDGTSGTDFDAGVKVELRLTAALLNDVADFDEDTLDSVTTRGATTTNDITVGGVTADSVQLTGGTGTQGTMSWNADEETVDLPLNADVTLQIGQESVFYGKAVGDIPNGAPVMFAGAQGGHLLMTVADMSATGFVPEYIVGVATQTITNGNFGFVTSFGKVRGLDTSGYNEGDLLYLDPDNAGQYVTSLPSAPDHGILMAAVTRVHAVEGTVLVRVTSKPDLSELCDVNFPTAPADGNLLSYDGTNGYWNHTAAPTLNSLDFRPDEDLTYAEGRLYYHDEYKTLTMYNDIEGVSLQIGLEEWVRVYNGTGSTIPNGTPCRPVGVQGENQSVAPAIATSAGGARVLGVATHDIPTGTTGLLTVRGLVSGIDTSGLTAGQPVFLNETGGLQNTAPTYPYYPTQIGGCIVSDATNGYLYVSPKYDTLPSLRVTGNQYIDGSLTIEGDLTIQGTQTITNEANLSISDSFIYLNSGDTIGLANTTFSGTGLDDMYFSNHYEGTTTTTYYVRIDGVGTGTGGVDTFEWSKDNFATTEATGVDLAEEVLLDNNICAHFEANTGHTLNDSWSGTAAPVNVDTGWFTNYNTGTTGIGYTHAGVYLDATDQKFKFVEAYSPEPSGNIDDADASYTLGTLVATSFEGTATDADKLNNQLPSYYLNYSNFTGTPTIGNATVTIAAGTGLGTGGDFTTNQTTNETITLTNTDKGSSQNIFKTFTVDAVGQDDITAGSNTDTVNLVAAGSLSLSTDAGTNTITLTATDTNTDTNDYVDSLSFNTTNGVLTAGRTGSLPDLTVDLDGRYLTAETDSQTLSWNGGNGELSISNGNTVDLDGRYAPASHVHNYDNYGGWTLKTDGTDRGNIASSEAVNFVGGSNVSLSYNATDNAITINSTDTNTVYSHPTHPGDDINVDTGPLTGATVISDLDFNVTTDGLGHVTDANAAISTRNLTAADVGAAPASHVHNYLPLTGGTVTGATSFTGGINALTINDTSGQQLVICAGEAVADGSQTGELVYVNAENGFQVAASNDNWASGYAGTRKTVINYSGITYNGNTVWHAGNDGSGSGLDADLLDGQQGSYYAAASSLSNYLPKANNSDYQLRVWDNRDTDTSTDLGTQAAVFEFKGNSTDSLSDGGTYHGVLTLQQWGDPSGGNTHQLAFTDNGNLHLRSVAIGGTWPTNWSKLWHSNNDGSGSGLDADLLDGQQGSYYLDYNNLNNKPAAGATTGKAIAMAIVFG